MICPNCFEKLEYHGQHLKVVKGPKFQFSCSPKAERSGGVQPCPPSANSSAGARADALPSLISSDVPRETAVRSDMPALIACPFCGSDEINNSAPANDPDPKDIDIYLCSWQISCGKCGCVGGSHETYEAAALAWNTRAGGEAAADGVETPNGGSLHPVVSRHDRADAIIKDILVNHLPRIEEGLRAGYVDENQILVMYDHAVRARILKEHVG